jgi:CubicO group peptidase (beta-lactamase class C family)
VSEIVRRVVAPGFQPVVAAFEEGFRGRPDMGAALAIRHHGDVVVDVYGGVADARTARPWADDTVSVIFSCTKGLMSILAAQLVESGDLDYDAPVAQYWPEFAQAGKSGVLVRHILSHRSGVSAPREILTTADALDWERVTGSLAAQEPLWEPGTSHAYHALTHGWLIGEVIRRITGRTPGEVFARSIARPLGVAAWIGLPAAIEPRVAHLRSGPTLDALVERQAAERDPAVIDWPDRAMTLGGAFDPRLVTDDGGFNSPAVHAAQIPGAGGIASAAALATIWSATVADTEGIRLVGEGVLGRAREIQSEGEPFFPVPGPWPRWGMGFQRDSAARRYLTEAGFGHDGAGGQVAFAEPELAVGFAYLTNVMEAEDPRGTAVVDALREVLR